MSLAPLIHILQVLSTRNRDPGENLGRISLSLEQWQALCAAVQHGLARGLTRFDSGDRKRWGAAFLLVGAKALRTVEAPFTYDKIGREARISALRGAPDHNECDAIEAGAAIWGIPLLRVTLRNGRLQRRFLGTMIRHSGAGWALLDKLAALVGRQRIWDWLGNADIGALADWIDAHAKRTLGEQVQRHLDLETREALAGRLQDFAAVRAMLGESSSPDAAVHTFGEGDLMTALDAPDAGAMRRLLAHFFASDDASTAPPRWRWHVDDMGDERPVVELPARLRPPDDLPAEVDTISLKLLDDARRRGADYVRRNDVFVHREGPRVRHPCDLPARLVAQYQDGRITREVMVAEMTVPTDPVAVFETVHGRLCTHARPGTRIALVPAPGWRMQGPDGFRSGGHPPLRAWLGMMPERGLECRLIGPDDEPSPWTLSTAPAQLKFTLTNAIAGLRLAQAPVVCGSPEYRSNLMRGKGTCTVRADRGVVGVLEVVIRGGRLKLSSTQRASADWAVGVFSFDFEINGICCTERVAILPAGAEVLAVSEREGTLMTLRHRDLRARLHPRDSEVAVADGDGDLFLPPNVHGPVVIDYTLSSGGTTWAGVWRVFAHPPWIEVVDSNGDVCDGPQGLATLRSGGGLRIYGEPRSTVDLQIEDAYWSLRLPSSGIRLFPFIEIPSELIHYEATQQQAENLRAHVRWPDGEEKMQNFVFRENRRINAWIVAAEGADQPSRVRVEWARPESGQVRVEAVRAWQPWERSIALPARYTTWPDWSDKSGYEADFSPDVGPFQIALYRGEQRLSGVKLIHSPDGKLPPPPSQASPLEVELWNKPRMSRLAELIHRWSEAGKDEAALPELLRNMTRFGVKWFRIAEVLPEILGSWRLERLLREEALTELDRLLADYDEQAGLAWMFVRERDLVRVTAMLPDGVGAANTLLSRIAVREAGLLHAGARVWGSLLSLDEPHKASVRDLDALHKAHERPRCINLDERDQIFKFDDSLDPIKAGVPRLIGLRQLYRKAEAVNLRLGKLELSRSGLPPLLKPEWFDRLPERLQEHERAIATWAWSIHRWRRGEFMSFNVMRELSRLEQLARNSLDYWLNSWDSLDPPKIGDKR